MTDTGESAFTKNRFRNADGDIISSIAAAVGNVAQASQDITQSVNTGGSHKHSKFERRNIDQHKKARKQVDDADERVRSAEMKLDPTGTLSEMNPVHIARMKKGKAKRKAVGQLALNILFPFAPIMRAIKKRRKSKKKQHSDDGLVRIYDNDSGMIAEENNYY